MLLSWPLLLEHGRLCLLFDLCLPLLLTNMLSNDMTVSAVVSLVTMASGHRSRAAHFFAK